jgi:hypothetical protein
MALVVLPEGQQRSGSAGGTTWSRNRHGAYIRNRSVPVNPNTDRQVAARNAVRQLTIAWQNTLTQAQRDAWKVYADNIPWQNKLGQVTTLTGLNHYVRCNQLLVLTGATRVDDAPAIFNLGQAEQALSAVASEATQNLLVAFDDAAPWCSEDNAHQFLEVGLPQNGGVQFFNGPWRYADKVDGDSTTPPTSPATVAAPFPFAEGQRMWLRSRIVRADGRLSEFAQVNFLAVS